MRPPSKRIDEQCHIETAVNSALAAADADPADETWQVYADPAMQAQLQASLATVGAMGLGELEGDA